MPTRHKEKLLKAGAIGCGAIFNKAHLPAWVDMNDAQLVALFDINPRHTKQTQQKYISLLKKKIEETKAKIPNEKEINNLLREEIESCTDKLENIKIYSDPQQLIEEVDVIDICTPVKYHAPYAVMGLEKNVSVIAEKPMARTWLEAEKIRNSASKSKSIYQLNDDNVFLPRYQLIKNIIESGAMGEIQCCWIARGSHGPEAKEWFWDPKISGGGCLMDYGTHAVTSLWYLIGFDKTPTKTRSIRVSTRHKHRLIEGRLRKISVEDDAHFKVMFRDPNNKSWITFIVEATWSWPELGEDGSDVSGYIKIEGSEGELLGYKDKAGKNWIKVMGIGYKKNLIEIPETVPELDSFKAGIKSFLCCVREGKKSLLSEEVGAGVMEILGSVYLSEAKGRTTVTVEEFREFSNGMSKKYKDDEELQMAIIQYLTKSFI